MSQDKRENRDLHALTEDGMVRCNRDREASHRADMEGIATDDHLAVTCRKCRNLLYRATPYYAEYRCAKNNTDMFSNPRISARKLAGLDDRELQASVEHDSSPGRKLNRLRGKPIILERTTVRRAFV